MKLYVIGINTCDNCGLWQNCVEVTIDKQPKGTFCLDCLVSRQFSHEQEVALPYTKKERKRTQKRAKKSEVKTAEETGGKCTGYVPSSGDSRNSKFFFEDKTRIGGDQKSYRLTQGVVLKGRDQARRAGLVPVFRIHLKDISIGAMLWDDLVNLVREESDE